MKYGDLVVSKWIFFSNYKKEYRFRIDPVPYVRTYKGWFGTWFKTPKTTQEKRFFYSCEEYVRGKRRPRSLANSCDDVIRSDVRTRKSWKKRYKCRKQWGKNV